MKKNNRFSFEVQKSKKQYKSHTLLLDDITQ
jgi:hypothetical protein